MLNDIPQDYKLLTEYIFFVIQEIEEKTDKYIQALKEFKKTIMKYLFTYGFVPINEIDKVELKETKIGKIPKEWKIIKLEEIAEIKYGEENPKDNGLIPVIGSGGIFSSTKTPLIKNPTIIIGRKGAAGKLWLMLQPCYPSDTTFYLKWKKDIEIKFLFNFMILHPLSGEHAKTTLPSIQRFDIENFKIPFPQLVEQQRIASILSRIDEQIEAVENKKKVIKKLFNSLLKNLMNVKIKFINL